MRQKDCLRILNEWNLRTRSGLRWIFQWKEFVMNRNDVKRFREVINMETKFLTSKGVERGISLSNYFFRSMII